VWEGIVDETEFSTLYERTYHKAFGIARGITRDNSKAEDAMQSAAEYLLGKLPKKVTEAYWLRLVSDRAKNALRDTASRYNKELPIGDAFDLVAREGEAIARSLRRRNVSA
jgi:DNA-directed RNA polymerase specialized sigma24 family protein